MTTNDNPLLHRNAGDGTLPTEEGTTSILTSSPSTDGCGTEPPTSIVFSTPHENVPHYPLATDCSTLSSKIVIPSRIPKKLVPGSSKELSTHHVIKVNNVCEVTVEHIKKGPSNSGSTMVSDGEPTLPASNPTKSTSCKHTEYDNSSFEEVCTLGYAFMNPETSEKNCDECENKYKPTTKRSIWYCKECYDYRVCISCWNKHTLESSCRGRKRQRTT